MTVFYDMFSAKDKYFCPACDELLGVTKHIEREKALQEQRIKEEKEKENAFLAKVLWKRKNEYGLD